MKAKRIGHEMRKIERKCRVRIVSDVCISGPRETKETDIAVPAHCQLLGERFAIGVADKVDAVGRRRLRGSARLRD